MNRTAHPFPTPAPPARGFSLVELLVVMAILALIGAFVAPDVMRRFTGAQADAARVQIENLSGIVDLYRLDVGGYPPDLDALVEAPPNTPRWDGPYMKKKSVPKDPWGNDYIYRFPGQNGPYDLVSLGADGAPGGEGDARDVVSWE